MFEGSAMATLMIFVALETGIRISLRALFSGTSLEDALFYLYTPKFM